MSDWIGAHRKPETQERIRTFVGRHNDSLTGVLILIWASYVFFHNIASYPVETDEALYAAVGRQIARTNEWFRLEHEGSPFFYKPPLFFWLMAVAIRILGENDFAVRFPSAALGLATTVLVYVAGKRLFSGRTALTAALITTTTYNMVWLAPRGKMDVELGFWMNLAFFSFLLAYREKERQLGFLVLSFLAMTIATLLKGPIGFVLPGFAGLIYLVSARKVTLIGEVPALATGVVFTVGAASVYYLLLGPDFNHYFFVVENLARITEKSEPVFFYFYMTFVDFFPWSLFLPCTAVSLWKSGRLIPGTPEFTTLVWFLSFLLLLTIPSYKEEDFLVYLVPPFALLMASSWQRDLSAPRAGADPANRCPRGALILLCVGILALLFTGPGILQKRYPGFPDMIRPAHAALGLSGFVVAVYVALRRETKAVFLTICLVAVTLTFGYLELFKPARGNYNKVKIIADAIRSIVGDAPLALSNTQGSVELLYYLDRREPTRFLAPEEIQRYFRSEKKVFALLVKDVYERIQSRSDLPITKLAEYSHRRWRLVLVENQAVKREAERNLHPPRRANPGRIARAVNGSG